MIYSLIPNTMYFLGILAAASVIIFSFTDNRKSKIKLITLLKEDAEIKDLLQGIQKYSEIAFFELKTEIHRHVCEMESKTSKILEILQDIQLNVKDLSLRVSITEVRLEERKLQSVLPAQITSQAPKSLLTTSEPKRRGRKPKVQ